MKKLPIIGLAALVTVGTCKYDIIPDIITQEHEVFGIHDATGRTLKGSVGYVKIVDIRKNGDDISRLTILTKTATTDGKTLPNLENERTLEVRSSYPIKMMHLLPYPILDDSVSLESFEGSTIDFIFESDDTSAKLPSGFYIRLDRDTIKQYRQDMREWQKLNEPLPKRY